MGSLSLPQGIFSTQGLNLSLLYCRWIVDHLSNSIPGLGRCQFAEQLSPGTASTSGPASCNDWAVWHNYGSPCSPEPHTAAAEVCLSTQAWAPQQVATMRILCTTTGQPLLSTSRESVCTAKKAWCKQKNTVKKFCLLKKKKKRRGYY